MGDRDDEEFRLKRSVAGVGCCQDLAAKSDVSVYRGNKLPKWKRDIFIGGQRTGEIPGTGHLERILVNEKLEELRREALLFPLGMRIRLDVRGVVLPIAELRNFFGKRQRSTRSISNDW